jgi:hypothetical protein
MQEWLLPARDKDVEEFWDSDENKNGLYQTNFSTVITVYNFVHFLLKKCS